MFGVSVKKTQVDFMKAVPKWKGIILQENNLLIYGKSCINALEHFLKFSKFSKLFIIFGTLEAYVCISHSQQKLPESLFFTKAVSNEALLSTENGLKPNELVDLSHETRFHLKNAETSFNEIFAN